MKLVFAGTPGIAVPSLEALVGSRHEVVAVVTRPDATAGRGRRLTSSPVAIRAAELGLEVLKPGHPRDPEFRSRLRELNPDVCAVVAYGALLPTSVLEIPTHGWINLHFSLLPRWRGAAPVQRAVLSGNSTRGMSTGSLLAPCRTPPRESFSSCSRSQGRPNWSRPSTPLRRAKPLCPRKPTG